MNIYTIQPDALTDALTQRWAELQATNPALVSPYFNVEFTQAVAAVRDDVRIAVMEEQGQPVGFFPFQADGRVGKPIGGALSDCHGVIVKPDVTWDVEQLIRSCDLDVWAFDHLLAEQQPFEPYHRQTDISPIMDLCDGYEAYAEAIRAGGSKQILKTGTLRRKLEREHGELRYEAHVDDPAILHQIMQWKAQTYEQSEAMFNQPWITSLLERIMKYQTPSFAGMLSVLYAGDTLVAAHFGMRSRLLWHYWFPAYASDYHKYSPGLILLLKMAESAPDRGLTTIDMGKGMSMYKERLMNRSIPLAEGAVELPSVTGVLRKTGRCMKQAIRHTPLAPIARAVKKSLFARNNESKYQ